jgi:two-component system OmpR family response regulator
MRVLIVEDDKVVADGMNRYLRQAGYSTEVAEGGRQADAALTEEDFDLVVLDLGLPGMDGVEVLRRLRARKVNVPVLIVTARDAVADRVQGLNLGADDYLIKPFALAELEARLRAIMRRRQASSNSEVAYGPLVLDLEARRATLKGEPLRLTASQWNVLEFLVLRAGKMVSKDNIAAALRDSDNEVSHSSIEVHVSRLRSKLEGAGIHIRSIRGFGYYLERPEP